MAYRIDWIGTVAMGVITDRGRTLALSLEEGQQIQAEFSVGDEINIVNHPDNPSTYAMGLESSGYYAITHVSTGTVLKTWHRADMHRVEQDERRDG